MGFIRSLLANNRKHGTPKTLGISAIFAFGWAVRQLRRSSEGAGAARRLFDGADTTGEIRFTSVRLRLKAKTAYFVHLIFYCAENW